MPNVVAVSSDLRDAILVRRQRSAAFVLVRDSEVLVTSHEPGLVSLVNAVRTIEDVRGAALADRVVGRAVALMVRCTHLGPVHGEVMSSGAAVVLQEGGHVYSYEQIVPRIKDRTGRGECPLERLLTPCEDLDDAWMRLREAVDIGLMETLAKYCYSPR